MICLDMPEFPFLRVPLLKELEIQLISIATNVESLSVILVLQMRTWNLRMPIDLSANEVDLSVDEMVEERLWWQYSDPRDANEKAVSTIPPGLKCETRDICYSNLPKLAFCRTLDCSASSFIRDMNTERLEQVLNISLIYRIIILLTVPKLQPTKRESWAIKVVDHLPWTIHRSTF